MRCLIGLAIASVLIAIFFADAIQTKHSLQKRLRAAFDEAKLAGTVPADAVFEKHGFGMELPGWTIMHVDLANTWLNYWFILAPLIVLAGIAIPWLLNRLPVQP